VRVDAVAKLLMAELAVGAEVVDRAAEAGVDRRDPWVVDTLCVHGSVFSCAGPGGVLAPAGPIYFSCLEVV
jgi:hypothetical protein